jgi:ABC-2 type transport system permease protein
MSGAAARQATGAAPVSEPSVHHDGPRTCWSSLPEALRAEWAKLRTLPGTPWLLAVLVALSVAVSTVATAAVTCPAGGCTVDPARTSLTGIYLGQALAAVLGVLVIGSEYSTGMIRTTFTAMPRRATVLAAKAVIVSGPVLAAGAIAVAGSLLAGRILLAGHGLTPAHGYPALTLADGPVLRAAAGSVLYLAMIALLSLGIAAIIRDPAPAIGTVLGLLYLDPIIGAVLHGARWHNAIQRYAPMSAGLAIQATTNLRGLPISPWGGLGVLAAWAGAALLTGCLVLRLRDT